MRGINGRELMLLNMGAAVQALSGVRAGLLGLCSAH